MKKILIAISLMMCVIITGCSFSESWQEKTEIKETEESKQPFEKVYGNVNTSIYVDTKTNVMYIVFHTGHGTGIEVMVDQDGKPRLWEE